MQPLVLCALILLQFYGVVQGGTLTQVPINTQNNPFGFYYYTPSNYDTAAPGYAFPHDFLSKTDATKSGN
jgi:hypothetical protein